MAIARGLTRVWLVLSVIHVLIVTASSIAYYYRLNDDQQQVEADIETQKQNPNAKPPYRYYGTPEKRLEEIHWEREQMKWVVPLIAVGPPIGVYCLAAALVWAIAGFKSEAPKNGLNEP